MKENKIKQSVGHPKVPVQVVETGEIFESCTAVAQHYNKYLVWVTRNIRNGKFIRLKNNKL